MSCRRPTTKLTAGDGVADDYSGQAVALSCDTAIVGAYRKDQRGSNAGAAYIFIRSGTDWTQATKLTASDGEAGDVFGLSVALSGKTAIVAAYGNDELGSNAGAAHVMPVER